MNMKLEWNGGKLTPRDKKLVVIMLLFVLIVGGGYFIIRPLWESNRELTQQIETEEQLKQENEQKLAKLSKQRVLNDTYTAELSAALAQYFPWMESQKIDAALTAMALKYDLVARNLDIRMPDEQMQTLLPYGNSEAAQKREGAEEADTEKTEQGEDSIGQSQRSDGQDTVSGLYAATATIELEGRRENLRSFLNECANQTPAARVTSLIWGNTGMIADGTLRDVGTLTLSVELYMIRGD